MNSLKPEYLNKLTYTETALSALKTIGEFKGKQKLFSSQTPEILDSLKQAAIIESSESSNRLEGITAPHKRIEGLVVNNSAPKNRPEQEIAGYRDALNLIHESANDMVFSNNVILQIHSMIYRYMPMEVSGRWKTSENEIVERNADGTIHRVRFKTVSAFQTPVAMERLVEYYQNAIHQDSKEPLVIIPLTILDFLCIHPFSDGNGRTARLLTLMLLYQFGYEVGRFISLERIFEESKETYYETLEKSSKNWHEGKHDPFPWLNYFWGVLTKAYREFEERVGKIRTGRGSKTELVRNAVARKIKPFSISDIERECAGTSRDMVRLVFRQMKAEGLIQPQGKGRFAKWIYRSK